MTRPTALTADDRIALRARLARKNQVARMIADANRAATRPIDPNRRNALDDISDALIDANDATRSAIRTALTTLLEGNDREIAHMTMMLSTSPTAAEERLCACNCGGYDYACQAPHRGY